MKPSFAQFMRTRLATASLSCLLLAGCATLPPPTQELAQAQQAVAQAAIRFARDGAPTGPELDAELRKLGLKASTFTQKLLDNGRLVEFSGHVRGAKWDDVERLLSVLRDDARVQEYELTPRKP